MLASFCFALLADEHEDSIRGAWFLVLWEQIGSFPQFERCAHLLGGFFVGAGGASG